MADADHWDRFRIKAEVQRRGYTLTQVALEAGLSDSACRVALTGASRSGAEALSRFLKLPLSTLFPGLYLRSRQTDRNSNANSGAESHQKRGSSTAKERVRA